MDADPAVSLNLAGAVVSSLPKEIFPALASLATAPPAGVEWAHEIKFDGYRILTRVDQGKVTLFTRRGHDWTSRIPALAEAVRDLAVETAVFDGELVVLDSRGASDFRRLQDALAARSGRQQAVPLVYYVFDLLYLDGMDLRAAGLVLRKALLKQALARANTPGVSTIRLSDHIIGQGPAFFAQVARMGLEGMVSKRLDAPYCSGRSSSWLKVKCNRRQEFVVVGFTDPKGSRTLLGALLLATHGGKGLTYRGRVGTGFRESSLRALYRQLLPLSAGQPQLACMPPATEMRDIHWVEPELVAEISFAGFTRDGLLRHATFLGLREDKAASEVRCDEGCDES